jgi:hypothetical protein
LRRDCLPVGAVDCRAQVAAALRLPHRLQARAAVPSARSARRRTRCRCRRRRATHRLAGAGAPPFVGAAAAASTCSRKRACTSPASTRMMNPRASSERARSAQIASVSSTTSSCAGSSGSRPRTSGLTTGQKPTSGLHFRIVVQASPAARRSTRAPSRDYVTTSVTGPTPSRCWRRAFRSAVVVAAPHSGADHRNDRCRPARDRRRRVAWRRRGVGGLTGGVDAGHRHLARRTAGGEHRGALTARPAGVGGDAHERADRIRVGRQAPQQLDLIQGVRERRRDGRQLGRLPDPVRLADADQRVRDRALALRRGTRRARASRTDRLAAGRRRARPRPRRRRTALSAPTLATLERRAGVYEQRARCRRREEALRRSRRFGVAVGARLICPGCRADCRGLA